METTGSAESATAIAFGTRVGWRNTPWADYLAEFLGTFVIITFGCGVVATSLAALPESGRTETAFLGGGDWLLITLGWAMAVTFGIYVAGGVSGAHLNPAVTLSFALRRGFAWSKVPGYIAAQLLGAFVGAAYADGDLEKLELWVRGLAWKEVLSLLDVSFSGGLIKGEKLFGFFQRHFVDHDFASLAMPS